MEWICLLMPACAAMSIRCRRSKKMQTISGVEFVLQWAKWVLAINLFTMGIVTYVLGMEGVMSEAFQSFSFFIKYSLIAIGLSFIFPYIVEVVEKYIEVSVEIGEQNEKDN